MRCKLAIFIGNKKNSNITAIKVIDSVDGLQLCTAFSGASFIPREKKFPASATAVWYTVYQGVFAVANLPDKLLAYIMA